jgi:hypothetical protein
MRPHLMTTRTTARVIGALFLAVDAAGFSALAVAGGLVSAPIDVAAVDAHGSRVVSGALLTLLMGLLLAFIPVVGSRCSAGTTRSWPSATWCSGAPWR